MILAVVLALMLIGGAAAAGGYVLFGGREPAEPLTRAVPSPTGEPTVQAESEPTDDGGDPDDQLLTPSAAPESSEPSVTPDPAAQGAPDPLKIGYPLANRRCDQNYVIILASSGDPAAWRSTLLPALQQSPGSSYLVTDKSCEAFTQQLNGSRIYAAYSGPFASLDEACQARSGLTVADAYVRQLNPDRPERDLCSCQDASTVLPALSRGQDAEPTLERGFAVIDLQALLYRVGINQNAELAPSFGPKTVAWVREFQQQEDLGVNGVVGPETWERLQFYC